MRLLLSALLILLSPGLPAYQAVAADFSARGGHPVRPAVLAAPAPRGTALAPLKNPAPPPPLSSAIALPTFTPASRTPAALVAAAATMRLAPETAGQEDGAKKTIEEAAEAVSRPDADQGAVLKDVYDAQANRPETGGPAVDASDRSSKPRPAPLASSSGEPEAGEPAAVPAPAPASERQAAPEKALPWYRSWFGLGFMPAMFIASAGVYQIGYESLGIGMQKAGDVVLGSFTYVAQMAVVRIFASMAGSILAPIVISKIGLRNAYWMSMAAQMGIILAMTGMLTWGFPVLPPLVWLGVLYGLSGFLSGITYTAHDSIITLLFKQNQAKLERFGTIEHMLLEILAVPTPIVIGIAVVSFGFLPAIIAYPVAMLIALTIVLLGVKFKEMDDAVKKAEQEKRDAAAAAPVKENPLRKYWNELTRGAVVVWNNVPLRVTFAAYALYMMFNLFIYYLLAATYGKAVAGDQWTSVQGFITGFYSAGGLVVTIMMLFESAKLARMRQPKDGKPGITPEQETEMLRQSMLRWMKWGTLGLVAFLAFLIPLEPLGSLVALPAWLSKLHFFTLPAIAMFLYGIPQVAANLKMSYFFKARIPEQKDIPAANGFFRAGTNLIYTLGLMGMSLLFQGYEGLEAFKPFAIFVAVIAGIYLFLTRALDKASRPAK